MTPDSLNAAIHEAERFLAAARRLQQRDDYQQTAAAGRLWPSADTGACRRASMDLTRSLAVLRG